MGRVSDPLVTSRCASFHGYSKRSDLGGTRRMRAAGFRKRPPRPAHSSKRRPGSRSEASRPQCIPRPPGTTTQRPETREDHCTPPRVGHPAPFGVRECSGARAGKLDSAARVCATGCMCEGSITRESSSGRAPGSPRTGVNQESMSCVQVGCQSSIREQQEGCDVKDVQMAVDAGCGDGCGPASRIVGCTRHPPHLTMTSLMSLGPVNRAGRAFR